MKKMFLGIAILFTALAAQAEVKPQGTVLDTVRGMTSTFPTATQVSVANVVGSENLYMGLAFIRTETIPMPSQEINVEYALITDVEYKGPKETVYTAYKVENNREFKYELTVIERGGEIYGQLKINGDYIFGGQHIDMDYIVHTMSL